MLLRLSMYGSVRTGRQSGPPEKQVCLGHWSLALVTLAPLVTDVPESMVSP